MDLKRLNPKVIEEFRAGGEIDGMDRDRLLLLTAIGRTSGEHHTTPMMFHRDRRRLLVVASNAGAPAHPDWYLNVVANPLVTVEIGDEKYEAVASPTDGEDRERLWAVLKQHYPFFTAHEARTERTIPVVELTKA